MLLNINENWYFIALNYALTVVNENKRNKKVMSWVFQKVGLIYEWSKPNKTV